VPADPSSPIPAALTHLTPTNPHELQHTEAPHLLGSLAAVPDPRAARGRRHRLVAILAMAAAAVLAGARSIAAMWLQQRVCRPEVRLQRHRLSRRRLPGRGQIRPSERDDSQVTTGCCAAVPTRLVLRRTMRSSRLPSCSEISRAPQRRDTARVLPVIGIISHEPDNPALCRGPGADRGLQGLVSGARRPEQPGGRRGDRRPSERGRIPSWCRFGARLVDCGEGSEEGESRWRTTSVVRV
jgi:hypothetical protein